jgi:hypothetical protein
MLPYGNAHPFTIASPVPVFRCKISIDKTENAPLYFPLLKAMVLSNKFYLEQAGTSKCRLLPERYYRFITPTNKRKGTYGSDAESGSYLESA